MRRATTMKRLRTIIIAFIVVVAATVLGAVAAAGVAVSPGGARGAATAGSGGATTRATGATRAAGHLQSVNPGGPMIPAGGPSVTVSHRVTAGDSVRPGPGPVRGL